MRKRMNFFMVGKLRYFALMIVLISLIVSAFFVDILWRLFNPATLFEAAFYLICVIIAGLAMYFLVNIFLLTIAMLIVMYIIQRKMKKAFKAFSKGLNE